MTHLPIIEPVSHVGSEAADLNPALLGEREIVIIELVSLSFTSIVLSNKKQNNAKLVCFSRAS